ncbi:MAG: hypothetical protein JSS09_04540 [Verrucomicrobia bacterium]|nr:hypothetical protein [Verrucomicrobiota bacterium]
MRKYIYTLFIIISASCFSNPFLIDFPEKEHLEETDYIKLQEKLRTIDTESLLNSLYPNSTPFTWFWQKPSLQKKSDFLGRISRGAKQTLINPSLQKKPVKKLIKINEGGDHCIVSFASYDGIYPDLLDSMEKALKKTGFNGHFLFFKGGFPNPTGKEIRYCAIPYCFKIFALLEAKKLGFHKVLWLDTALLPLKDLTPIFEEIEKTGCFFHPRKNAKRYLLPQTRDILLKETGVDMYKETCIRARIIGLDLQASKVDSLIQDYYRMVELGTPFLSCFPEEFVLGALIQKSKENWTFQPFKNLVMNERKLHEKDLTWTEQEGFFFLLRHH